MSENHTTKVINTISDNMVKLIDETNKLKNRVEILEFQNIIDENIMYLLFFTIILLLVTIYYSIYTIEVNNFGLILYNYCVVFYNKIHTYLIYQFVEYKKVIYNIHYNNSYDEF